MQRARHLHVVESLAHPVAAWDSQERRHRPSVVPPTVACPSITTIRPGADVLQSPPSVSAHFRQWPNPLAARVSYVAIVLLLVTSVVAWLALTVRLIAWLVG